MRPGIYYSDLMWASRSGQRDSLVMTRNPLSHPLNTIVRFRAIGKDSTRVAIGEREGEEGGGAVE